MPKYRVNSLIPAWIPAGICYPWPHYYPPASCIAQVLAYAPFQADQRLSELIADLVASLISRRSTPLQLKTTTNCTEAQH